MTTAFYSHADCREHDMGRGHPECGQRLDAIQDHLIATGLADHLDQRSAPLATLAQIGRAHSSGFVNELQERIETLSQSGEHVALDPDTSAGPGTWNAVMRAAGAAVAATDAVIDGDAENAFCAVRPPGHHATRDRAMGFCFFNSIAVAARHALDERGLERVAIIDFAAMSTRVQWSTNHGCSTWNARTSWNCSPPKRPRRASNTCSNTVKR